MKDQDKGTGETKRRRKSASENVDNVQIFGARIAQWLERRTLTGAPDSTGAAGYFFSTWSFFCADSYFGIRSTPVLPQSHVKDPGYSAKSAGGRLQLNMHAPYVVLHEVT